MLYHRRILHVTLLVVKNQLCTLDKEEAFSFLHLHYNSNDPEFVFGKILTLFFLLDMTLCVSSGAVLTLLLHH